MEGMSGGALYEIIKSMTGKNLNALGSPIAIYWVLLIQNIWKETGWGTIIFLAALAGVDVEQYEAAIVDGASRFQQLIYITLPASWAQLLQCLSCVWVAFLIQVLSKSSLCRMT